MGYKRIEIKYPETITTSSFSKPRNIKTFLVVEQLVSDLIGVEIIEDTREYCVLEEITELDSASFQHTLQRGLLLLNQYAQFVYDTAGKLPKQNDDEATSYFIKNYSVDKFFKYAIKLLHTTNLPREELQRFLLLINNLQLIAYTYAVYGMIRKEDPKAKQTLEKVNILVSTFTALLFQPGISKLNAFADDINSLQTELSEGKNEYICLLQIVNILKLSIMHLPLLDAVKVRPQL